VELENGKVEGKEKKGVKRPENKNNKYAKITIIPISNLIKCPNIIYTTLY
jgi:hypothetical protein